MPSSGDRRLGSIGNTGLTSGQYSNFAFDTTPENQITGITETSEAATAYPAAGTQTATYNAVNELTDLSGQAFTYDANGNLTSDGTRTYSWDADNRLIGIAYPATPGKATTFAYDGLGRRITISHTPAGGGAAVATTYVWCGDKPCQVRDAANQPQRAYYTEGERLLGSSPSSLFYGVDQLGTVRRVFASPTSAPAYGYDPYGVPLQTTAPLTDFGYAGLFNEPDSGLGLATYRAYDPRVGRWLSRDPIGEGGSKGGNLYGYVGQNPVTWADTRGLAIGDYPPPLPGYDPQTWTKGVWPNGKDWVSDPNGNTYTVHTEDAGHWRHWDKRDDNDDDQGQCPPNSSKPWPGQKRGLKSNQSASDPNGNAPPWSPTITLPAFAPILVDPIPNFSPVFELPPIFVP